MVVLGGSRRGGGLITELSTDGEDLCLVRNANKALFGLSEKMEIAAARPRPFDTDIFRGRLVLFKLSSHHFIPIC